MYQYALQKAGGRAGGGGGGFLDCEERLPSGWVLIWGRRLIQGNKVLLELVGKGTLLIPKGSSLFPPKIICQCITILLQLAC